MKQNVLSETFRQLRELLKQCPIILHEDKVHTHWHLSWFNNCWFLFSLEVLPQFYVLVVTHQSLLDFLSLFLYQSLSILHLQSELVNINRLAFTLRSITISNLHLMQFGVLSGRHTPF